MSNDNNDAPHRASERGGYWAFIDELLQKGADVDAIDRYGNTPLHCAAGASALGGINIYAVRKLVSAGANVNAQGGHGRTALWFAIVDASRYANTPDKKNEVDETVDILLSANADPNSAAFNGMAPIIKAVKRDFVRIVSAMNSKKNVEVSLKNVVEALFAASELGHAEVARYLLINGVDANAQRSDGETPLAIDRILSACFNSLGNAIITSSADGAVRLWDPKSGRQIGVTLRHDQCIVGAAFNAYGDRIVTECQDGFCQIWICDQQSLGLRS